MSIVLQTQKCELDGGGNGQVQFELGGQVQVYAIGITGFSLNFANDDNHHIMTVSLSVSASHSGNVVSASVRGVLSDDSGHHLDPSSYVALSCVAVTGSASTYVSMGTAANVADGQQSGPPGIPIVAGDTFCVPVLSGFDVTYGNGTNHEVFTMAIGAGLVSPDDKSAFISSTAHMGDHSGNRSTAGSVDGFVISVANAAAVGLLNSTLQLSVPAEEAGVDFSCDLGAGVSIGQAAVMLSSFNATFARTDERINTVSFGIIDGPSISGSTVKGRAALLLFGEGHSAVANATLQVFGVKSTSKQAAA